MRRRWRRQPEILFQFALGGLAAAHRFRDQLVGQNQPRVGDVFHHQQHVGVFVLWRVVAMQLHGIAFDAAQHAAEALAALMGDRHLDLDEMAGITLEIGAAHQRAVDPGRGNFQPVGALDRIGDVKHRRQRPRDRLAILDQHGSIRPLRHDLDGAAGFTRNLDADQPIAHALQHRTGDIRHPRGDARLDHEARLGKQFGVHGTSNRIGHIQCQSGLTWSV